MLSGEQVKKALQKEEITFICLHDGVLSGCIRINYKHVEDKALYFETTDV